MCALAIFPSWSLVSPFIIRGGGLGQGCWIWSCRLCTIFNIYQAEDSGAEQRVQHSSNPNPSLPLRNSIGKLSKYWDSQNHYRIWKEDNQAAILIFFSLLTRGLGRNRWNWKVNNVSDSSWEKWSLQNSTICSKDPGGQGREGSSSTR